MPNYRSDSSESVKGSILNHTTLGLLSSSRIIESNDGIIIECPTSFHLRALRNYQDDVSRHLSKTILEIRIGTSTRTNLEKSSASHLFKDRIQSQNQNLKQTLLPMGPRTSGSLSQADDEKKRRLPATRMLVSPNLQVQFDMAKRWAEDMNSNPQSKVLWIYGKAGSGKTTLAKQFHDWTSLNKRLTFVNTKQFFNEWRSSLESQDIKFKRKYRKETDLLILEDIDSLETLKKTQTEILFILESLLERGASIVVTSCKHPQLLKDFLEPALFSRLYGGLSIEMPTPDRDFREQFWRSLLEQHGLTEFTVDLVVQERLLSIHPQSARELQSIYSQAIAYLSIRRELLLKDVLDLEARVLGSQIVRSTNGLTAEKLLEEIAKICGVSVMAIQGPGRRADISLARRMACLALSKFLGLTNSAISCYIHKDTSTVTKAIQSLELETQNDRHVCNQWEYICSKLGFESYSQRLSSSLSH